MVFHVQTLKVTVCIYIFVMEALTPWCRYITIGLRSHRLQPNCLHGGNVSGGNFTIYTHMQIASTKKIIYIYLIMALFSFSSILLSHFFNLGFCTKSCNYYEFFLCVSTIVYFSFIKVKSSNRP